MYRGKDGNADKIAVRGISISMSRGQCFGVLGPNGAGKTTLINMVSSKFKSRFGYNRLWYVSTGQCLCLEKVVNVQI